MTANISDHAVLRWMERHHRINVDSYREELRAIAQPAIDIRASVVPLPDGLWLLIKNDTVVTVTTTKPKSLLPVQNYVGEGEPHWKHRTRRRFK